jgi:hypothetical protein
VCVCVCVCVRVFFCICVDVYVHFCVHVCGCVDVSVLPRFFSAACVCVCVAFCLSLLRGYRSLPHAAKLDVNLGFLNAFLQDARGRGAKAYRPKADRDRAKQAAGESEGFVWRDLDFCECLRGACVCWLPAARPHQSLSVCCLTASPQQRPHCCLNLVLQLIASCRSHRRGQGERAPAQCRLQLHALRAS